ncbi:collagen alpha-3(VI) chain [Pelobates cultripes]|uniref:Collagen alpha-3(VI) chain n=2 Tax=Pelobates cultripes TaxID=61616 RepID=A0AAD1SRJ2_PELCU|nr:collagen alpha-3(VI) chain [Pelobates cultripes]
MREHSILPLVATFCLVLSGISRVDAQEDDSADLIFLIDGSKNVGRNNFSILRDFLVNFVDRRLDIGRSQIQVAVVQYSDEAKIEFTLDEHVTKSQLLSALRNLQFSGGEEANLGVAIDYVVENLMSTAAGSRKEEGVPQSLVIITAGASNDDVREASNALKINRIITFGIGVDRADTSELQQVASDASFVFVAPQFSLLRDLEIQLIPYIAGVAQRTIVLEAPTTITEVVQVNRRDIVFLVDGSSAIGGANFAAIREFIVKIVNRLEIGSDLMQVALAQYARDVRPEFYLNTYNNKKDLIAQIKKMKIMNGTPLNTGAALNFVRTNFFTTSAGSRISENIPQILVLITGGQSRDEVAQPSLELKRAGILTFTVGSKNADQAELQEIAFDTSLAFQPSEFKQVPLQGFLPTLLTPLKTLSGSVIVEGPTEADESAKRDIVFLVDGSDGARTLFPSFRNFIQRIVENLDVGLDKTRVAVVQYSDTTRPVFLLNTHTDSQSMVGSIRPMTPIGGSPLNTGSALDYVTRNVFISSAGSRASQGVAQFLILLTSGRSNDETSRQAALLRASGVVTYAIGVGRADQAELQNIAFSPRFILFVPEITQLQNAYQTISQQVSQTSRKDIEMVLTSLPPVRESKRDILFLVDASSNVAGKFPLVRDFVLGITESLNISPDDTRVSVAQVGETVKVEFKFDSFPSKQEVINAVKRMRLKPDRRFNVGAALDYAHSNLFTPESGSRIQEGVPQYLVLLSAGRSEDDVEAPANKLKRSGVVTFAVKGSTDVDSDQLEKIVLAPQFVVSADSLADIATIQPQFTYLLKTITVEAPTVVYDLNQRKDIVFLLDGSDGARSFFPSLRSFIQTVVEKLDVGQDRIRVGVVQYSDTTRPSFLLNAHPDRQGVVTAVRRLTPIGGSPLNTGAALDYVTTNIFTGAAGSRKDEGVPQFLVLLTTGRSRDDVRGPANALKRREIVPFAIGVNRADLTELQSISFVPDLAYSFSDITQLGNAYQTFTTRLSQLTRGEIEVLRPSTPSTGVKRDVVFLVDGSREATREFENIRELIGKIVEGMDVSPDSTRVSVVQYSDNARVDFLLNAHSTKDEVQNEVRRLKPKGGNVANIGSALEYVSRNIFTKPAGSRIEEQVPQFLILTATGPSADNVDEGATRIKESSVVSYVIGKNIDTEEAKKITLSEDFVLPVSSFRELPNLEQRLITSVTDYTPDRVTKLYSGYKPVPKGPAGEKHDIVFLIDGSTNTGSDGLARIRDFIYSVVQKLQIGENQVRVGVVQFSNDAFTEFKLNQFSTQQTLLDNIRRLRHRGGAPLNIGKAMEYVVSNLFVKAGGSRIEEGVPQHLVLLTGGKSQDDVRGAARSLGSANIKPHAVITSGTDVSQIQTIISDPRYIFSVKEFAELPTVQEFLLKSFKGPVEITTIVDPQQPDRKEADIVFLVDGSINLGRDNFKEVLQFVSGIVDAIYEEGDSIQIGLAQYNSDVTDEFFLKEYTDRDAILEAVTKAEYKGGRLASLGTAIGHLQEKHFVKPAGSRIGTNVPQVAFIITGAKTVQDGEAAALALTNKGVQVFSIGVGSIAGDEISKIASNAPSAFRVPNVQELSELNEQILITLNTALTKPTVLCPKISETKECNLEVIVGFDVSGVAAGQNIFSVQVALESKLRKILESISKMHPISCSGQQAPSVKVSVLSQSRTGAVEAFDFSDYRPELVSKITGMGTRGPYVLTSQTLQTYLNKFKTSGEDSSIKVVIHLTDGADEGMGELQDASLKLQSSGVKSLLFVGLENAAKFEQLTNLDFGRGFKYGTPLYVNQVDLEYVIVDELDNIAEKGCCGVPCKCSGERGDYGPTGPVGKKGEPGMKGHRGFPGEEGGPGERGPPGVNGTQGFQGCPGPRGMKGNRGIPGDKGEVGEMGLDGIEGEEGKRGIPGTSGEKGSYGPRGEKGTKGTKGERGDSGLRGDPGEPGTDESQRGPKGGKGETGPVGDPGRDGTSGTVGDGGKVGPVGRRGPPGPKGNRGNPGLAGGAGEQGLRGPQGPPGEQGAPGTIGEQGLPGPRGPGGIAGTPGDRGRVGPLGHKGEPGDPGIKGSEGPAGPRGETGDDGRDGVGKPGLKGRKGETGFPGYPGLKGDAGDKGPNGELGPKGNRGRRGNAGSPGTGGVKGDPGYSGPSGLKGERGGSRDQCALVKNIKDKCPCCYGPKECPVFPTDLVFAVDTSSDVNRNQFNNMKQLMQRVINKVSITDSNCPRGARVAMVTYNSDITTEIRFSDALRKPALLERINNMQITQTTKQRSLDGAMSFVARNTFKRARGGFLIRKVAVFFSNGPTRASPQLNEAVLKLYDAGVSSVFLTNREDRALSNALQVNNTVVGEAIVLSTAAAQFNQTIQKVLACHICLDVCEPDGSCGVGASRLDLRQRRSASTDLDVDFAFLIDSSESTMPAQFAEIKKFVSHVVGQFELSSDPKSSSHHARVSILQQAPYEHQSNHSLPPVRVDVGLTEYTSKDQLQTFILSKMTQLYGTRSLNSAIKYVVENVFENAPNPRAMKVIFLILTGEVKAHELHQLHQTVNEAKCKGFFIIILSIGKKVNAGKLHTLASEPHDVFSKKADKPSELHEDTLLRFGLQLPGFITSENAFHLSPEIQKQCDWFQNDQPVKIPVPQNETRQEQLLTADVPDELLSSKTPDVTMIQASTESPKDYTPSPVAKEIPSSGLQVSDVTESTAYLNWASLDPHQPQLYDLSVISLSDNSIVQRLNVTSTEILIGGLQSERQYQITITGNHKIHGRVTYKAIFTTDKAQVKPQAEVNTETLDNLDIAEHKIVQAPALESKSLPESDICNLEKDGGTCRVHILKWYYDPQTKSCTRFWYGGCGGNGNRFDTQKDCEKACIPVPLNPGVVSAIGT